MDFGHNSAVTLSQAQHGSKSLRMSPAAASFSQTLLQKISVRRRETLTPVRSFNQLQAVQSQGFLAAHSYKYFSSA